MVEERQGSNMKDTEGRRKMVEGGREARGKTGHWEGLGEEPEGEGKRSLLE